MDIDEGGNKLQNYPVITKFYSASSGTSIAGYLESSPNKIFKLQFFSNSSPNSISERNGEVFLGEKTFTTDANGRVEFQANFPNVEVDIAGNHSVSVTATDENGNTSEFSSAITTVVDDGDQYILK